REGALTAMNAWAADLAVVGLVKKPDGILSLWFVRRPGGAALHREDHTCILEDVDPSPGFNNDFKTQLVAMALGTVAPLAKTEARSQVLEKALTDTGNKIKNLLKSGRIKEPLRLVKLHNAHGIVLRSLGELKGESEWFAQAANSYNEALVLLKREDQPVAWAQMQTRLGGALGILGGMENDRERLIQAVAALNAALTVHTQTDTPIDWANTQNNLGNALHALGHLEESTERLEQARLVLK
ncbi:MAG: tetratricopeptide repeat protein, partial [Rhodospirillaceae bacterium]|nr:tetratricopeptide repeat protein [Rhodospirillaceae bacterium]